jgi:hypothetical protein
VTTADYPDQIKHLDATLRSIEAVLDLSKLRKDKEELEIAASVRIFGTTRPRRKRSPPGCPMSTLRSTA